MPRESHTRQTVSDSGAKKAKGGLKSEAVKNVRLFAPKSTSPSTGAVRASPAPSKSSANLPAPKHPALLVSSAKRSPTERRASVRSAELSVKTTARAVALSNRPKPPAGVRQTIPLKDALLHVELAVSQSPKSDPGPTVAAEVVAPPPPVKPAALPRSVKPTRGLRLSLPPKAKLAATQPSPTLVPFGLLPESSPVFSAPVTEPKRAPKLIPLSSPAVSDRAIGLASLDVKAVYKSSSLPLPSWASLASGTAGPQSSAPAAPNGAGVKQKSLSNATVPDDTSISSRAKDKERVLSSSLKVAKQAHAVKPSRPVKPLPPFEPPSSPPEAPARHDWSALWDTHAAGKNTGLVPPPARKPASPLLALGAKTEGAVEAPVVPGGFVASHFRLASRPSWKERREPEVKAVETNVPVAPLRHWVRVRPSCLCPAACARRSRLTLLSSSDL